MTDPDTFVGPVTYEEILEVITDLDLAPDPARRAITWLGNRRGLAVARDQHGAVEMYVAGPQLFGSLAPVKAVLSHDVWTDSSGSPFEASRLRLDRGPHLDPVAAMICIQLLTAGIENRHARASAFARSEQIIALALERIEISNAVLIGLAGELVTLRGLIRTAPQLASSFVSSWAGYMPSTRDIQLANVGVEIKTTTGTTSTHHIQGTHQVDLGVSVDGEPETHLYLLSIGIAWLPLGDTSGQTVSGLIEEIAGVLAPDARDSFLKKTDSYGGAAVMTAGGFDDSTDSPWHRPFYTKFERLYDLTDPEVHLLHGDTVAELTHVDPTSVTYRVALPQQIRGDLNPTDGLRAIIARLLETAAL